MLCPTHPRGRSRRRSCLLAGEMRALRPGEAPFRARHTFIGSRVDFCGPAIIGLTALFAPGPASPHAALSEKEACKKAADLAGGTAAAAGVAEGSPSASAAGVTSGGSSSDEDDGREGGDDGGKPVSAWQQDATALTECQLWCVTPAHALLAACLPVRGSDGCAAYLCSQTMRRACRQTCRSPSAQICSNARPLPPCAPLQAHQLSTTGGAAGAATPCSADAPPRPLAAEPWGPPGSAACCSRQWRQLQQA